MPHRVTVVGAGNVGATAAQRIVEKQLADVVLVDILEGVPQGKALDMMESAPVERFDARLTGSNAYDGTAGSDVVVITAGLPRKPGMSRDDLVATNEEIVADVVRKVLPRFARRDPDRRLEPARRHVRGRAARLEASRASGSSGWPGSSTRRGCAGSSRRRSACPSRTRTPSCSAATATRWCRCRATRRSPAMPVTELLPKEKLDAIVQRTRDGGAEIVNLLKTSAWYAPSSAVVEMVDAVLRDKKKILPCAAYLQGEYGMRDVYLGVPVKLGRRGRRGDRRDRADATRRRRRSRSRRTAVRELFTILKV